MKYLAFLLFASMGSLQAMEFSIDGGQCSVDGVIYPAVGFGTCLIHDQNCKNSVDWAAYEGYRIIDTATLYSNFVPVGESIKRHGRQNFYIVSKVWHNQLAPANVRKDLAKTLGQLKTNYLDAYLIHWPNSNIPIEDTLWTMEDLRKSGKIRHIGLSNVTVHHLKRALETGVPISWVQIEMHPFFCDFDLLEYCAQKGIAVQAWCPLDRGGRVKGDALLQELGQKYRKSPQQIALRWINQHGCIPLPCSSNPEHIRQNLLVTDFSLTAEEMGQIDERARYGSRRGATKAELGFTDEFHFTYEQCWPRKV
ncbi:MAG: aldo/keto reductase [Chlamydiales bacterium]|nr:aldo/keto reductase [Chlamydiales bacterium]